MANEPQPVAEFAGGQVKINRPPAQALRAHGRAADLRTWKERCQQAGLGIAKPDNVLGVPIIAGVADHPGRHRRLTEEAMQTEPFQLLRLRPLQLVGGEDRFRVLAAHPELVCQTGHEAICHSRRQRRSVRSSSLSRRVQPAGCVMVKLTLFGRFLPVSNAAWKVA